MRINLTLKSILFALFAIFIVGCAEDGTGGIGGGVNPTKYPPSISSSLSTDVTINAGENVVMPVLVTSTGSPLKAIFFYKDNEKLSTSDFLINGNAPAANPIATLSNTSRFEANVTFLTQGINNAATYKVEALAEDGSKSSVYTTVSILSRPPSITISGATSGTFTPGTNLTIKTDLTKGSGDFKSIAIYEDGTLLDPSRIISFAGSDVSQNPFGISTSQSTVSANAVIKLSSSEKTSEITFEVTDSNNQKATTVYTATTKIPYTDVDSFTNFLLANQGGPAGRGGADLDITEGSSSVGSSDSRAEIKDLGINTNLPAASNWIQRIAPANNAQMKYLKPGQNGLSESFQFSDIQYRELLPTYFSNGTALSNGSSDPVRTGDMFIIERDGKYYAIKISEIVVTTSDNNDYYKFELVR